MSVTSSQSPRAQLALQAQGAHLEQALNRLAARLKLVPLKVWQWLLCLLLVIWLCHSLAQLLWLLVPSPQIPPPAVASLPTSNSGKSSSANDVAINIEQLKSLTPFGAAPVVVADAQPQPEVVNSIENEATDTQLNLMLRGVVASNHESAARAVITAGDKADVYAIGDKLPVGSNVTLAKVLELRVILNNGGHYESLWLFKDDPKAPKISSTYSSAPSSDPRAASYGQNEFKQYSRGPAQMVGPRPAPEAGMAEMSKTLADVVAMSIYRENGQVVGYKIRPGRNAEMFNSLGLQTDDIVTAVNGVPLTSPGKIMEIYKNMSNATSANLEIRRSGSVINLDVVLN